MGQDESYITWLEKSAWVGAEIKFSDCEVTRWKITSKISEKEEFWEETYALDDTFSQACAVFVCCNPETPTQEAVLKVLLQ